MLSFSLSPAKEKYKNQNVMHRGMIHITSKKAFLDHIGDWFFPALIALALGFAVAYMMSQGIVPDPLGLF